MSGRKQHYIPQSLLKGFSLTPSGRKAQVQVYTHDRGQFTAGTDGIAAERNFYSELNVDVDAESLDDRITVHENALAADLSALRRLEPAVVDRVRASEIVAHLAIRNDHVRKIAGAATAAALSELARHMADPDSAYISMGLHEPYPTKDFAASLDASWAEYGDRLARLGLDQASFVQQVFDKAKADWERVHSEISARMRELVERMMRDLPGMTSDAQRSVLSKAMVPQRWTDRLSIFDWRIEIADTPLILPDCVAIALRDNGSAAPLIFSEADVTGMIILPVSAQRMLVGSSDQALSVPANINAHLAESSWDYFVAAERSDALDKVSGSIRRNVKRFINASVAEMIGAL